jgi:hypothetical protein
LPPERFADVQAAVKTILTKIAAMAGELLHAPGSSPAQEEGSLKLRVISPLAEGADRLAARAALECGMEIQCPLPFHRDEYERDFPASRAEFRDLLARASAVMELDGDRRDEGTAYLNAGKVVIEQSDVLLAVWDGQKANGHGGTAEIVAKALRSGVPLLVIPPSDPAAIYLLNAQPEKKATWESSLRKRLAETLALGKNDAPRLQHYFEEVTPGEKDNAGWLYKQFRTLIVEPGKFFGFGKRRNGGIGDGAKAISSSRKIAEADFGSHYQAADTLSNHYAGRFRSAYLARYLCVLCAVVATTFGFYTKDFCAAGFGAQVGFLALAALLVFLDSRRQWHLRSLEYRLLAENLRMMHFLHPLGLCRMNRARSILRDPPAWIAWHLRNIARNAGLPSVTVTPDYLVDQRDYLESEEVIGQKKYHVETAAIYQKMAKRLYGMAFFAFVIGIVFFALRAWESAFDSDVLQKAKMNGSWPEPFYYWTKVGSLLFPSLGAVLAGIRSHGEFARLSGRSEMMADFFKHKEERRKTQKEKGAPVWEQSVLITREITEEMQMEISDWRTMIGGKNLTFPF